MINQRAQLPFSASQLVSAPRVSVRLSRADFSRLLFHTEVTSPAFDTIQACWNGPCVYYSSSEAQTLLGWLVVHGSIPEDGIDQASAPFLNAVANVKVMVDAAISMMAKMLEVVSRDHLLVVSAGPRYRLVPRRVAARGSSLGDADAAMYMALNPGEAVLNSAQGTQMAGLFFAYSGFDPDFLLSLDPNSRGAEPIRAIYSQIVSEAQRAAENHRVCGGSRRSPAASRPKLVAYQ